MRRVLAWARRLPFKRLALYAALVGAVVGAYAVLAACAALLTDPPRSPSDIALVTLIVPWTAANLWLLYRLRPAGGAWWPAGLAVVCTVVGIAAAAIGSEAAFWACVAGAFAAHLAVTRTRLDDAHSAMAVMRMKYLLLRSMFGTLPEPKHACSACGDPITGSTTWIGDQGPFDSKCGRARNQAADGGGA